VTLVLRLAERALLKGPAEALREVLWARARKKVRRAPAIRRIELAEIYRRLHDKGDVFGGGPLDIAQRIVVHVTMYRRSFRNFTFPLLALHGAGWAHGYFRLLDRLLPLYA